MCVGCVFSWALIVLLFPPVYCCSHFVSKLCIFQGGDCAVLVSLFIAAPNVCVGYVLSWAVIVLLLLHCLLLLPLCV